MWPAVPTMILFMLALILMVLVAGSLVYCVLIVAAAWRYTAVKPPEAKWMPPISVLKPLSGVDEGLDENLRSFFEQEYPEFEILFAVRVETDPAVAVVEELRREFPEVPAKLILTGEPPYPNAKVYSLDLMMQEARHELMVMSDSDIRVTRDMLQIIAAEFEDDAVSLATCPYRATPGKSKWSTLEAL